MAYQTAVPHALPHMQKTHDVKDGIRDLYGLPYHTLRPELFRMMLTRDELTELADMLQGRGYHTARLQTLLRDHPHAGRFNIRPMVCKYCGKDILDSTGMCNRCCLDILAGRRDLFEE